MPDMILVDLSTGAQTVETVTLPPPTVEQARAVKLSLIDTLAEAKIAAGVPHDGTRFPIDRERRDEISAIIAGLNAGFGLPESRPSIAVRDQSRTKKTYTEAEFKTFAKAAYDYTGQIKRAANEHVDAVLALSSAADVEAYDATTGWPE